MDGYALPVKKLKGTDPVETLDLSGKNLGGASLVVITSLISVKGGLTKLSLARNRLGEEGTKAICEALEQNKTLKELDVSGGIGGSAGAKRVAKMLGFNGGLTALNLSDNSLKDEGVNEVCEAIKSNKETKLASLNFKDNGIGPVGAKSVAAMVAVTGGLTKISLAKNKLGEEGTKAICEAIEQNTTLNELDISGGFGECNIGGSAGAKHVAKMLGVNGALTVSNLLGNQLDAESAKMLAEVAKQKGISLCGIQRDQATADLCGKRLQPPDAILLASDLSQAVVTGVLTALDLSLNELKDEGVSAVCEAIQSNKETKLASLNMGLNSIGSVGAKSVAAMMAVTGGLTSIDLRNNNMDKEGEYWIHNAVRGKAGFQLRL